MSEITKNNIGDEITITVPTPTKKRVYKSRADMTPEQLQRRRELDAKWRETNREVANRRSRECEKKRYNENAEFKELKILQGRVRHAEKAVGGYTSSSGQST